MEVGVPKIIYETLEDILECQIRKLAVSIAKTLNVNEKILIKELKKEKIKTYLYEDETDVERKCKSYVQHNNVYVPCEHPIVYNKEYCINHLLQPILKTADETNKLIEIVFDTTKYYRDINNKIYNSNFDLIGKMYNQEIRQFIIED